MIRRRLAVLVLCSIPLLARGQGVVDDQGIAYNPVRPPRKIVSLTPDVTEILFALGLDREIVGVTRYCDYPAAAREKQKIGGIVDPSLELIHSLAQDGLEKIGHHGPMGAMGVPRSMLPSWEDIQILPAQLATKPLAEDAIKAVKEGRT